MTTSPPRQHLSAHQQPEANDLLAGLPDEAASRAEGAARAQLEFERVEHCLQDAIALNVRHATIAVKLYEERESGNTATLEHLLAFLREEGYQAEVLRLRSKGHQPKASYSNSHCDIHADWLPADTLWYFSHASCGAFEQGFSMAADALSRSQSETTEMATPKGGTLRVEGYPDASDPMQAPDPRTAAAEAAQFALRGLSGDDGGRSFFAETVALTVRHAALAVQHYEARNENEAVSLEQLLAFFSDNTYRKLVLGIPSQRSDYIQVPFVSEADWLPAETYSFFEHAFYGVWTGELRREHYTAAVNAIALGSAHETMEAGE